MLLWVGLGNPEPGMALNRHNIGFMAIDSIADTHGFGPWRRRFRGALAEGYLGQIRILALKPLTYMNDSGDSVQPAVAFYKLDPAAVTIFHDEIDLAPGKVRVKHGGGTAGHNGLRSIERRLGSADFWRVRLGIGHPGERERVRGHVLGDFPLAEHPRLKTLLEAVADAAPLLARGEAEAFMTRVALLTQEGA